MRPGHIEADERDAETAEDRLTLAADVEHPRMEGDGEVQTQPDDARDEGRKVDADLDEAEVDALFAGANG